MEVLKTILVACILTILCCGLEASLDPEHENKVVLGGDSFYLLCKSTNTNRTWLKDTQPLPYDWVMRENYSVKHATDFDTGMYTCGNYAINVVVEGMRLGFLLPPFMSVVAGEDVKLDVPVLELGLGTASWDMAPKILVDNLTGKVTQRQPNNIRPDGTNLYITNVSISNEGRYRIQVRQHDGLVLRTSTNLTVFASDTWPIDFKKRPSSIVSVDRGKSVLLECLTTSEPTPNITWSRAHVDLFCYIKNCSKRDVGLEIFNAAEAAAGEYICTASNNIRRKNQSVILIVNTPPKALRVEVMQLPAMGEVNITWQVAENGGYAISTIILHPLSAAVKRPDLQLLEQTDRRRRWAQIGPLDVGVKYHFEMWARNMLGGGEKVWVNFTYKGPGTHTIATNMQDREMRFEESITQESPQFEDSDLRNMQHVLLAIVLCIFALMVIGGLACLVLCKSGRNSVNNHKRIRQDSETSDVVRLAANDQPPALHSWSFINPLFEENVTDNNNMNNSNNQSCGRGGVTLSIEQDEGVDKPTQIQL